MSQAREREKNVSEKDVEKSRIHPVLFTWPHTSSFCCSFSFFTAMDAKSFSSSTKKKESNSHINQEEFSLQKKKKKKKKVKLPKFQNFHFHLINFLPY